jgi:hypothetical protein
MQIAYFLFLSDLRDFLLIPLVYILKFKESSLNVKLIFFNQ